MESWVGLIVENTYTDGIELWQWTSPSAYSSWVSWARVREKVAVEEALWGRQAVRLESEEQQRRSDTSGKKHPALNSYSFIHSLMFQGSFVIMAHCLAGKRRRSRWRRWGSIMRRRLSITRRRSSAYRRRSTATWAKSESSNTMTEAAEPVINSLVLGVFPPFICQVNGYQILIDLLLVKASQAWDVMIKILKK